MEKLHRELIVFAMLTTDAPSSGLPVRTIDLKELSRDVVVSSETLRSGLKKAQWGILHAVLEVFEHVAKGEQFSVPQQPQVGMLDSKKNRYVPVVDPGKDSFRNAVLRGVARCMFEAGHLVKECQAPAKMKPGRKGKGERKSEGTLCGKLFVARKQTQLYCSGTCMSRTLTRKKRARKNSRKRERTGRAKGVRRRG